MSIRKAFAFAFLGRYAGLTMNIVSSMIIARLLSPAEIGVFSVTMVLLSFISTLRDFGAGQYLLQEKQLTQDRLRATWTVQLGSGLFAGAIVLIVARPVAIFYGDPRMTDIMMVIALNFWLNPFGTMTNTWLMREMRFDVLAGLRFSSDLTGACTCVLLAWKGYGPISLALGNLSATAVYAVLSTRFRPAALPWLPGTRELRRVLGFGGKISTIGLVNNAGWSAPELLLGKLQDLSAAAFFSRANGLASMFMRLIFDATQAVALPMFAKQSREGNVNGAFIVAMSYLSVLGWTFFGFTALLAFPLVHLLYGPQWDAAVSLTRLLSIGLGVGLLASLCPTALTATGAVNRLFRVTVCAAGIYMSVIAVGAWVGLMATGISFIVVHVLLSCLWLFYTQRELNFEWRALGKALCQSFTVAAIALLAPALVVSIFGWQPSQPVLPLIFAATGGALLFFAAVFWTRHPIRVELLGIWRRIRIRPTAV